MKASSKYRPLLDYLRRSQQQQIELTFGDIEQILGSPLPQSARQQRAWWSNRSKGAVQASAWMEADYLVETLDLAAERVTFSQPPTVYQAERVEGTVMWNQQMIKGLRRHMGATQVEFAKTLGVRQQTISEWEQGVYAPTRASSKHLSLVAQQVGFPYDSGTS